MNTRETERNTEKLSHVSRPLARWWTPNSTEKLETWWPQTTDRTHHTNKHNYSNNLQVFSKYTESIDRFFNEPTDNQRAIHKQWSSFKLSLDRCKWNPRNWSTSMKQIEQQTRNKRSTGRFSECGYLVTTEALMWCRNFVGKFERWIFFLIRQPVESGFRNVLMFLLFWFQVDFWLINVNQGSKRIS